MTANGLLWAAHGSQIKRCNALASALWMLTNKEMQCAGICAVDA